MTRVKSAKEKKFVQVHCATVRFAGDSGDGMQLAGSQFADIAAMTGTVVCTLPDFPSEIRAPAGSLGGVSGYQLNFADYEVHTPGDSPYVLIAMNPAALKVNLADLQPGGIIVVNEDEFTESNLAKAEVRHQSAHQRRIVGLSRDSRGHDPAERRGGEAACSCRARTPRGARNFFALGLSLWLYDRPASAGAGVADEEVPEEAGGRWPPTAPACGPATTIADTAELFSVQHTVAAARLPKGRYRRVTGNEAAALGLVAAAHRAGRTLVYASYPITPASEILHELSKYKEYDVRTLQTEDEIAACVRGHRRGLRRRDRRHAAPAGRDWP